MANYLKIEHKFAPPSHESDCPDFRLVCMQLYYLAIHIFQRTKRERVWQAAACGTHICNFRTEQKLIFSVIRG